MIPRLSLALVFSAALAHAGAWKLITWNIEWYPGRSPEPQADVAAAQSAACRKVIADEKPDFLLAQEMRDWEAFATLSEASVGLKPVVVSSFRDFATGRLHPQQLGIATRLPVEAAWAEEWRPDPPGLPRGYSLAVVKVPGSDGLVLLYSVHLKSNRARTDEDTAANVLFRNESARQLVNHVSLMERLTFAGRVRGVLVAGDFNTNQDKQFADEALAILEAAGFRNTWDRTPRDQRMTWRGNDRFEPTTFDHVLVKGLKTTTARMIEVPDETSDHWPVTVTIKIPD